MFLYAHYLCPPTKLFFFIPVNKVWQALFHPKVHAVDTGNWCATNATSKPPKLCIGQLVLTQKIAMLLSMVSF